MSARDEGMNVATARKGVEMSLNLIILIVIGLIVAAIVIYLVASNTGRFNSGTSSCAGNGGQCKSQCDTGETGSAFFTGGCAEGQLCCKQPLATS